MVTESSPFNELSCSKPIKSDEFIAETISPELIRNNSPILEFPAQRRSKTPTDENIGYGGVRIQKTTNDDEVRRSFRLLKDRSPTCDLTYQRRSKTPEISDKKVAIDF